MSHPDLVAHAVQTVKDIVEPAPGIWTASDHAAANLHLVGELRASRSSTP